MNTPLLFSIIIPTYNRASFIRIAVDNFLKQTYSNFEIIIIDDGSTDNTKEVVSAIGDDRIRYYWKENGERGSARKMGAALALGEYINYFDCDDIAYPNHLEEAAKAIVVLNKPMIFYLGSEMRNGDGKIIYQRTSNPELGNKLLLKINYLNPNPVFVHRDTLSVVTYNPDRSLSGTEDWLYHLQLAVRYTIMPCDKIITTCMIEHEDRSMNTNTGENVLLRAEKLEEYLRKDHVFMAKYSNKLCGILGEMYALAALHFSLERKKAHALKYSLLAISKSPFILPTRRMAAICKYLLIK